MKSLKNRKMASVAVAASLLGGAAIGAFGAQPMTALAADSSTTETQTATARTPGQWMTDALKGLVDKGTITQQQSDAVATALKDAKPERGFAGGGKHASFAKAAEVIGISETDLREAMKTKSLADIAKEKNVDVQKVIDALVADENTRIDQAVKDGKLTQAQADERKSNVQDRVTQMVNNVRPEGRPGGGGRGDRGGFEAPPAE